MNTDDTFELDRAIAEWRKPYDDQRRYRIEDVDELERHLRDHFEEAMREGASDRAAFQQAQGEVGDAWAGEVEYRKVYWGKVTRPSEIFGEMGWSCRYALSLAVGYTVLTTRSMRQHKTISAINIGGLAIGLMCAILAIAFVRYHLDFDTFQQHPERTYRVLWATPGKDLVVPSTVGPMAPALVATYPEIVAATRIDYEDAWAIPESGAMRTGLCVTDPSLFDVFDYTLIAGNRETVFTDPMSIVITESAAVKWFGTSNVVGETLTVEAYLKNGDYTITGVLEDPPPNTSRPLKSFSLISTTKIGPSSDVNRSRRNEVLTRWEQWTVAAGGGPVQTYIKLRTPEAAETLEGMFPEFIQANFGTDAASSHELRLQPLTDLHLYGAQYGLRSQVAIGSISYQSSAGLRAITLVAGIAALILLVACINFVNLSTARAVIRQKEIGVRKSSGALRHDLFIQFTFESILAATLATGLGISLVQLVAPLFAEHSGLELPEAILSGGTWTYVILLPIAVGLFAGFYPSFVLSSVHLVRALKQKRTGETRTFARQALTIIQFATCILLIVATLVMRSQTRHLMDQELGFDRDLVIAMPIFELDRDRKPTYGKHLSYRSQRLKQEVLEHPDILAATTYRTHPGVTPPSHTSSVEAEGQQISIPILQGDQDYLDFFGLQLIAGRNFNPEARRSGKRDMEFVLNESAVRALGWEDPATGAVEGALGKPWHIRGAWSFSGTVVGVVKDFHAGDLRQPIGPTALWYVVDNLIHLAVKVQPQRIDQTLTFLDRFWQRRLPERPFEYTFLDEEIGELYRQEVQTAVVMNDFSILGILLGCMGLFGLATFAVERKIREVGIRKSLGATVFDIVYRLSKESGLVLIAANLIAWPVGFYFLQDWLDQFVYRIDLHLGYFLLAGGAAIFIALFTVALLAVPAARSNPIDALRHE